MMSPYERFVDALERAGCRPRALGGSRGHARCPVHGGKDRDSLSFSQGADGRVLAHCQSKGCSFEDILDALGLEMKDAFPEKAERVPRRSAIALDPGVEFRSPPSSSSTPPPEDDTVEATYRYTDESGALLIEVLRLRKSDGRKSFRQRTPDGSGGWNWRLGDTRRPLYRLPEVLAAVGKGERVLVVEGEKCVEALRALGFVATCNLGGACDRPSKWSPEWTESLRGAEVVILPDNDTPGREHAETVRAALADVAKSVRVVTVPGEPKSDIADYIESGHGADAVRALLDALAHSVLDLETFLDRHIPPKDDVVSPWLKLQDVAMIHAKRGVGKTWVSLSLALGIATGSKVIDWGVPKARRVLYVDGEMPAVQMKDRIARVFVSLENVQADPGMFLYLNPDIQVLDRRPRPTLKTSEGRERIREVIQHYDPEVVFFDNLACLYGGAEENDAGSWDELQGFLLELRSDGLTSVVLHHSGKGGAQRGTSHREDILDTVVRISHPHGYRMEDGARFIVEFEKIRSDAGVKGGLRKIEAQLREDERGALTWTIKDEERTDAHQVAELLKEGYSQREIGAIVGHGQSWVQKRKNIAADLGLLDGVSE